MKNNNILEQILQSPFPIMIKSSAGSGKTHSLVAKINHTINVDKVNPQNILAITFTLDAANEMKNRIDADGITIGTMHSIMYEIVRSNHAKSWYVCDDKTRQSIAFDICKETGIPFDDIPIFFNQIDFAKNKNVNYHKLLSINEMFDDDKLILFAKIYEEKKIHRHKLDFADMLLYAYDILTEKPSILSQYQEKYKYIFVDEYQDTNPVQHAIVNLLASKYRNLLVVGDLKQSIFGFNASSPKAFMNFIEKYPEANVFELPLTYRCAKEITKIGNTIASHIDNSHIETVIDIDGNVYCDLYDSFSQEVRSISHKAISLFRNTNKSIKIIFRTNAQALGFQLALIKNNIPFSSNTQNNIFNRKECKIAFALCNLIYGYDGLSLGDKIDVIKNLKYIVDCDTSDWHLFAWDIKKYKSDPLQSDFHFEKHLDKISALNKLRHNHLGDSPSSILETVAKNNYIIKLSDNATDNLNGLSDFFIDCRDMADVNLLINEISKPRDISKSERVISLSTVHGSKGLEADIVFVCGIADGLFPSLRSDLDEETRLFYVAATRAREELYLSGCLSFGKRDFKSHLFLQMIEPDRFSDNMDDVVDILRR